MEKETKPIQRSGEGSGGLDKTDRKILGYLAQNSERSYAELSDLVHLSAPAIHERVKRLRRTGTIRATVAILDGPKVGRGLLAFVHLETSNWDMTRRVLDMADYPEVEEIHTVAGDTAMILKVRTEGSAALEMLLGRLHKMEGFKSVKTFIALGTYLERGPMPANSTTHPLERRSSS